MVTLTVAVGYMEWNKENSFLSIATLKNSIVDFEVRRIRL